MGRNIHKEREFSAEKTGTLLRRKQKQEASLLQVRFFVKMTQMEMSIQRVYCGALLGSISMGEYKKQDRKEEEVGLLHNHSKASNSQGCRALWSW